MTSKFLQNTQKVPAAIVMATVLFSPFISSAQVIDRSGDARFCSTLDTLESKILAALSSRLDTAKTRYNAHLDTIASKRDTALTQLETKRDQADVQWEQTLAQMNAKAKTDDQKAAIAEYEATVNGLIDARRATVDTAVATFITGVNGMRNQVGTDYNSMLTTHKAAMEAAFDTAAASCAAGTAPATVRAELRADISAIRETFKQERIAYASENRTEFTSLRQTRKATVEQARQTFRTGFEEANAKLRAAIGQ